MDLVSLLSVMNKKIESLICYKARENWSKHDDSCSRFFHFMLRWRRLRNEVKGVEVGGQWCLYGVQKGNILAAITYCCRSQ